MSYESFCVSVMNAEKKTPRQNNAVAVYVIITSDPANEVLHQTTVLKDIKDVQW